jgi:Zn-dependent peptidase ImmA (M78 family)/transcriptional regulator with XRE-family HTH domain
MRPNGSMFRLARQRRGLHQTDAAPLLGVEQPILSRVENDLAVVTDELLQRAETAYSFPRAFFFLNETIYGPPVSVHPMWRKKADVSAREIDSIVADLNIRGFHLRRILEGIELRTKADIPRLDVVDFESVEKIAALVRAHWQIPSGPIKNLMLYAERAGIIVMHSNMAGTPISGVTYSIPGLPPMILLNEDQSADRMRFTLAHEIGHLVMHKFPSATMEEEANEFASNLLMPSADLRQAFKGRRIDLALLGALKPEWLVSMQALLMRAKTLGFLTEGQNQYLWKQISARGLRLQEPPQFDFPKEIPTVMPRVIEVYKSALAYSDDEFAKLLVIFPDDVASMYGNGRDKRPRPKLTILT